MIFQITHKIYERVRVGLWRIKAEFMKHNIYVAWNHIKNVTF